MVQAPSVTVVSPLNTQPAGGITNETVSLMYFCISGSLVLCMRGIRYRTSIARHFLHRFINLRHLVVHWCRRPRLSYQSRLHTFNNHSARQMGVSLSPVPENEAMIDRSLFASLQLPLPPRGGCLDSINTQALPLDIRFPHHPLAFCLTTEFTARWLTFVP